MRNQADKIEKTRRVRIVMEWILEDWPSVDIVAKCVSMWGISDRQAKRYISDARKQWVKEESAHIEQKRRMKIAKLNRLKRSLKDQWKGTPAGITAVLRVEKQIDELEGYKPARKIQVSGKDGQPIQVAGNSTVLILPSNGRELTDGKQSGN